MAAPAAAVALALAATAPAPPRPALTASPGRVVLDGAARAEVHVAAPRGVELVDVALAPYALDLRGRPRLGGAARAPRWVSVRPARLRVGRAGAHVTLAATPPRGAAPGDRPFALVLTTRSPHGGSVAVRLRIGVLVVAHVPGKVARRLVIGPLRVRPAGRTRLLELAIRNAGNVMERLAPGRVVLRGASARPRRRATPSCRPRAPPTRPRTRLGAVPGSASWACDRARDPRRLQPPLSGSSCRWWSTGQKISAHHGSTAVRKSSSARAAAAGLSSSIATCTDERAEVEAAEIHRAELCHVEPQRRPAPRVRSTPSTETCQRPAFSGNNVSTTSSTTGSAAA